MLLAPRVNRRPQEGWQTEKTDVAISAGRAIEGPVITAAAAPGWISWADLGSGSDIARTLSASITRAGIWREVLEFVRLPLPLLRVGWGRFFDRDVRPSLCVFRIQRQPFLKARLGVWLDRVDRAFRLAHPAVDALVRMDNEHVLALIEAVDRAHLDAVHKLTANTAIVDDVGQLGSPPADCRSQLIHHMHHRGARSWAGNGRIEDQRPPAQSEHRGADIQRPRGACSAGCSAPLCRSASSPDKHRSADAHHS